MLDVTWVKKHFDSKRRFSFANFFLYKKQTKDQAANAIWLHTRIKSNKLKALCSGSVQKCDRQNHSVSATLKQKKQFQIGTYLALSIERNSKTIDSSLSGKQQCKWFHEFLELFPHFVFLTGLVSVCRHNNKNCSNFKVSSISMFTET